MCSTLDGFGYPDAEKRGAGSFFDQMRRYFLERAAAIGLEAIDLDPEFLKRHAATGERFEYPNDAHWNPNGHRIAANALKASRMLNSGCDIGGADQPASAPTTGPRIFSHCFGVNLTNAFGG